MSQSMPSAGEVITATACQNPLNKTRVGSKSADPIGGCGGRFSRAEECESSFHLRLAMLSELTKTLLERGAGMRGNERRLVGKGRQ